VLHGKPGSIDTGEETGILIGEIQDILADYERKDISNMDETGLYWKKAPTVTLATEQPEGVKQDKSRITAMMCGKHSLHCELNSFIQLLKLLKTRSAILRIES